jgi:arylsulfatase A-like enzyme
MLDAYRQEVEYLDAQLGRLFDGLRDRNLYGNTLIVFTADHGEEFYEHEGWWHGQTLYDELIHIPLMIKLPNQMSKSPVRPGLARHVDIAPTILSLVKAPVPEAMQGKPIFGAGDAITASYAEVDFEGNDLRGVRTETHKLVRANEDNPRELAPVEFYDLVPDPGEQDNLAGEGNVVEAALQKAVDDMKQFVEANAAEPIISTTIDQSAIDQLESLGYLE